MAAATAPAQPLPLVPAPAEPPRYTKRDKFLGGVHPAEVGVILGAGAANLTLFLLRNTFENLPGRPVIDRPAPDSIEIRIENALFQPGGRGSLSYFGDYMGSFILPMGFAAYYISNGLAYWISDRTWTSRMLRDPRPETPGDAIGMMWGALEVVSWSGLLQQTFNSAFYRERPYVVLNHPELQRPMKDDTQSFYSGHTSMAFSVAAYGSLHLGGYLYGDVLRTRSLATRVTVGYVLPSVAFYGLAAVVGFSRLQDQTHFLSDVMVGSIVGTALGNGFYFWHAHLRRRFRNALFVPTGQGVAYVMQF